MTRQIRDWSTQIGEFGDRPSAIREKIIEVTRQLSESESAFNKWNGLSVTAPKDKADLAADQAQIKALDAELANLEQEALTLDSLKQLAEARLDLAESDLAYSRDRVATLESRTGELVNAQINDAERLANELGSETLTDHPLLRDLVAEMRTLATKNQQILVMNSDAGESLKTAEERLDRLKRDAENIRAQIEIRGLEGSFSDVILEIRRELPTPQDFRESSSQRRKMVSDARLDAFQLEQKLDSMPSVGTQFEELSRSLTDSEIPAETLTRIKPILKNLLEARNRLIKEASEGNRKLVHTLGEIELIENETLDTSGDFKTYLGENMIWVASSPPLGVDALRGFRTAFRSLLGTESLSQYARAIARISLPKWTLAILLVLVLLLPRKRLRRYLQDSAARTRKISTDGIGLTLGSLAASLWLALPFPALLGFFGWVFSTDPGSSDTTYGLGKGLIAPSFLLLVLRYASILCWPEGVAEAHFRWNRVMISSIHHALITAIFLYLPAHLLLAIWFSGDDFSAFQGPGRLVFIASMVLIALIIRSLLRTSSGFLTENDPSLKWVSKLRRVWTTSLTLLPVALAILAALGYFLTAVILAFLFMNTALVIFAGTLGYGLMTRWVTIKGRRIALQNAIAMREEKRRSQAEKPESEEPGTDGASNESAIVPESILPADEEISVNWNTIGEQTGKLIRAIVMLAVVFGCWLVWSEIIPILKYLDSRNLVGDFSISDLIWLGLLSIVTGVVFQNLPGFLEVTFLQTLELDSGLRNAVITICQYIVISISVAIAVQTIGWDASQFGWIAAALSVGLGFGLQEVVANFVCGLILLFERPIRVGDIVTVGGVDGVVTKIRIRATTITNWDRKEFIVPNKEFVTGTLMNWTLTNAVIRLVLPVGVSYGSDVRQVHDVLLEIAREQPEVLKDPPPIAVFESFGDSSLNFTLRCFVARPEIRLEMTHRINIDILERFKKLGIEIPFPQRDLNLRSIDSSISFVNPSKSGSEPSS